MPDIKIAGVVFRGVPQVDVPTEAGGTASFLDTTDADATAEDIAKGKTAYSGGMKITGTLEPKLSIALQPNSSWGLAWNTIAPLLDTSMVDNMSGFFWNLSSAQFNPDVSHWDTSRVMNMDQMFYGCNGAAFNPDVSKWDVKNVSNMQWMYADCKGDNFNPDLDLWDVKSVNNMANMFSGCYGSAFNPDFGNPDRIILDPNGIYTIRGHGWETQNVTTMRNMLYNIATQHRKKVWAPKSFVATRVTSASSKPFYADPGEKGVDLYTDATSATAQGWGTIHANYTVHWGSTHSDFVNATP